MNYKKVENSSKRTIFIDTPKGETVAIPAGGSVEDIELDSVQVKNFEDLNMVKAEKAKEKKAKEKKAAEAMTLPEEFTAESLAADFKVDQLKAYCKTNKITGITGKNELEIAEMIVADHAAKNSNNEE